MYAESRKGYGRKKNGKILILNSLAAYRGRRNQVSYCTSKGAMIAFVENESLQLGRYNINVNAIAPGIIDIENPEPILNKEEKIEHIPMKRQGRIDELIGPAIFFASDDSSYVNGVIMKVDGGFSARLTGTDF